MAGLDLEMPGPTRDRGAKLVAAVEAGEVPRARRCASGPCVLRLMARTGALDDHAPHEERAEDRPEHRALIRRAGARGRRCSSPTTGRCRSRPALGRRDRPERQGGADHGRGLGAAQRALPRLALGGARRGAGRGAADLRPRLRQRQVPADPAGAAPNGDVRQPRPLGRACRRGRDPEARASGSARSRAAVERDRASRRASRAVHRAAVGDVARSASARRGCARVRIDGGEVAEAWESWTPGTTFFEEGCDEVLGDGGAGGGAGATRSSSCSARRRRATWASRRLPWASVCPPGKRRSRKP